MEDDFRVDPELFRKTGWTRIGLIRHLRWDNRALTRELKKAGLSIETRRNHSLNDRDVETILTLYLKRRAERLLGCSRQRTP